jgi:hypothetical protein
MIKFHQRTGGEDKGEEIAVLTYLDPVTEKVITVVV